MWQLSWRISECQTWNYEIQSSEIDIIHKFKVQNSKFVNVKIQNFEIWKWIGEKAKKLTTFKFPLQISSKPKMWWNWMKWFDNIFSKFEIRYWFELGWQFEERLWNTWQLSWKISDVFPPGVDGWAIGFAEGMMKWGEKSAGGEGRGATAGWNFWPGTQPIPLSQNESSQSYRS